MSVIFVQSPSRAEFLGRIHDSVLCLPEHRMKVGPKGISLHPGTVSTLANLDTDVVYLGFPQTNEGEALSLAIQKQVQAFHPDAKCTRVDLSRVTDKKGLDSALRKKQSIDLGAIEQYTALTAARGLSRLHISRALTEYLGTSVNIGVGELLLLHIAAVPMFQSRRMVSCEWICRTKLSGPVDVVLESGCVGSEGIARRYQRMAESGFLTVDTVSKWDTGRSTPSVLNLGSLVYDICLEVGLPGSRIIKALQKLESSGMITAVLGAKDGMDPEFIRGGKKVLKAAGYKTAGVSQRPGPLFIQPVDPAVTPADHPSSDEGVIYKWVWSQALLALESANKGSTIQWKLWDGPGQRRPLGSKSMLFVSKPTLDDKNVLPKRGFKASEFVVESSSVVQKWYVPSPNVSEGHLLRTAIREYSMDRQSNFGRVMASLFSQGLLKKIGPSTCQITLRGELILNILSSSSWAEMVVASKFRGHFDTMADIKPLMSNLKSLVKVIEEGSRVKEPFDHRTQTYYTLVYPKDIETQPYFRNERVNGDIGLDFSEDGVVSGFQSRVVPGLCPECGKETLSESRNWFGSRVNCTGCMAENVTPITDIEV